MTKTRIPTIFGIGILVFGLATGVLLIQQRQFVRISASSEAQPKNVNITNITHNSATISWTTDKSVPGFVKWGKEGQDLTNAEVDSLGEGLTHFVTIGDLEAGMTYEFTINSDGYDFDNNGLTWRVSTGQRLLPNQQNYILSGRIISATQVPVAAALVYIYVEGAQVSTTTEDDGSWFVTLASARDRSFTDYANVRDESMVEISIQTGTNQITSAQTYALSSNPLPDIVIGKTNDFRNFSDEDDQVTPEAEIKLPENEDSSGFKFE